MQPTIGREFTAEEDKFGGQRVAVISDALWKRRFGARPDVIGKQIRLDGEIHTIVGVMPTGFDYPRRTQIWRPVWRTFLKARDTARQSSLPGDRAVEVRCKRQQAA